MKIKINKNRCKVCDGTGWIKQRTGQWLRQCREALGLSRHDLAQELECSESYVAMMEQGKRKVSKNAMTKLIPGSDAIE